MTVRDSLARGLATITETSEEAGLSQLDQLAAIAEENARMARQLADGMSQLARSWRKKSSAQLDSSSLSLEGSSVDPPHSRQNHYFNYCTIL